MRLVQQEYASGTLADQIAVAWHLFILKRDNKLYSLKYKIVIWIIPELNRFFARGVLSREGSILEPQFLDFS